MGDPRARSKFGEVDLGIDGEADAAFGELDWAPPEGSEPSLPGSAPRSNAHTKQTIRRDDAHALDDRSASHVAAKDDRVAAMRELYARGDADAALALAEAMDAVTVPPPELIPVDEEEPVHERDMTCIARSTTTVPPAPMLATLTERHGIPRVVLPPQEISKLPIDHRAGFLLGFIDGMQTMEEILDVCAMTPGEALDLIRSLVDMGVIVIE